MREPKWRSMILVRGSHSCHFGGRALFIIALALVAATSAPSARAQCGANRSTCSACHDGAHASYAADAAWHKDHGFADVCAVCHGGAPDAAAAAAAHLGLVAPLAGETQCISCHGDASAALARRYATYATDTDAGATREPAQPTRTTSAPSSAAAPRGGGSNNVLAKVLAAFIGALGLGWIASREGRLRLFDRLRRPDWSPYLGGVVLGLVVAVSMGVFGHRLSGAGAYQHLSGVIGKQLAPHSMYWMHVVPTGFTWDVQVVIGAIAGAFVSSRLAGTFRWRAMPDRGWNEVFGKSVALRWAIAFFGSMLTEIGGGLAGGCTASLAVSGGAVLAPAAFIFMMGMFAGGIPTLALVTHARTR